MILRTIGGDIKRGGEIETGAAMVLLSGNFLSMAILTLLLCAWATGVARGILQRGMPVLAETPDIALYSGLSG